MFGLVKKIIGSAQDRAVRKYFKLVSQVNKWDETYKSLSDEALKAKTAEFQKRIQKGETLESILPEAFATVKNACRRMMGTEIHVSGYNQPWDMVPFDVQIVGGIALHNGSIAEMMTGEGKTLTAVLPCYLNALTGKSVHLVTVNDYLAKRDCEWVGSVLRWLGLTTGALTNDTPMEERHEIYAKDVVYGTASEFGFDYLRDNSMASSKLEQVQRNYFFAIVDEVDSILIDEARTPLIISGPSPVSRQMYDELKKGVGDLVRLQRDECGKLATEAKRVLDNSAATSKERDAAFQKLWLVAHGTPRNKVLKRLKEDPDNRAALDKWELYYYSDTNKQERADELAKLYIIIDERANEFELTDKGSASWQEETGESGEEFVMLDISEEYLKVDQDPNLSDEEKVQKRLEAQEKDAKRKERSHNLRQLFRAHLLMERDVDYIVQGGKIVIIDENTGRPQPGRRFSDGLHQAIEAKEGVEVQRETQTYATITLQNYFRMYDKLAGMTGTAITEAGEFKQIYKMDVLQIPTHRPCIRTDAHDEIYMSEREKYAAILEEIKREHAKGRPMLIGTESVEISEKLARILKQHNLQHTVLNAKHHEMEAEIVAHAGRKGAITIATNMAGRGTDIKLDPGVAECGGLHVIGTTRHQSRRIDRQLRGRCARQGDPGSSKFYVSFEDQLLRLFASPKITALLQRFRPPEGEPISAGILNKSIETAQKRVEQRNYMMRKHTLEYDDVMNKQRQEIYAFRNEILHTEDVTPIGIELIEDVCYQGAEQYPVERGGDPEEFQQWLMEQFPVSFDQDFENESDAAQQAAEKVVAAFKEKLAHEEAKLEGLETVQQYPAREAIRRLMIRRVDQRWQEHLLSMDHLRADVTLRAVGQRDPLMEFKQESFRLFDTFSRKIYKEITHDLFRFEIIPKQTPSLQELLDQMQMEQNRSLVPGEQTFTAKPDTLEASQPIHVEPQTGRNEPCPCGSGKKYKKCCGAIKEETHT